MPPLCKTCSSPNLVEYEKLRKEGKSLRELSRVAKDKYCENISYKAFSNHFKSNHDAKERQYRQHYEPPNKKSYFRVLVE